MNERAIFDAALEIQDPDQRRAFLHKACGDSYELRARIEALLAAHDGVGSFLDVPAIEQVQPGTSRPIDRTTDFSPQTRGEEDGDDDDIRRIVLSFLQPSQKPGSIGTLGHYEILKILGQGGFGVVLKAFDEKLHRHVAIKMMNPRLAATSPPRKRFLREARAAAAIRHENIVQVHSVEEQPLPYLVMEYISGDTLQQKLDAKGPLSTTEVLHLGRQIAAGLAAAHASGLIHRDIKPGNILIEEGAEQKVKITDFGMARAADDASITRSGVVSGTPMYMAPEQALGKSLDHRADLFSLGSVLYQMACGRPPFRAATAIAVLRRVVEDTPRPMQEILPEIPAWLVAIVSKLHSKNPDERFQSAKEVADLLARCQAELQLRGNVESLADMLTKISRPSLVAKELADHERLKTEEKPTPALKRQPSTRRSLPWATALAAIILLFVGLSLTEATGVSNFRGTVIRLFSPDGTLVVEVDDPGVSVSIEGEEMVITGAGAKEIRLKPGQYKVLASKDGKVVSQELVTVSRNGRQVVRVSREAVNQSILQSIEKLDRRPQFRMGGEWRVEGNELVQASPSNAAILFGDRNWTDYDFQVELNSQGKTKDGHGAGILYRATDLANFFDFQVGGWSATVSEVTFLKNQKWGRVPGTFLKVPHEHHRWYKAKVEVRGPKIRCAVDGKDLFVFENADHPKGMVGISNGNSPIRWRNLKVTAPDGRVLWEGFPDLGPAAPLTDPDRKAAEWVLSIGGVVRANDPSKFLNVVADLPTDRFSLTSVFLRNNPQVSDSGLAILAPVPGLVEVILDGAKVTDDGLVHLSGLNKLKYFSLRGTKISDAGLAHVKVLNALEMLWIDGTEVSDAGLVHLKQLKNLKSLDLRRSKVTASGVADLHASLPSCTIEHDGGVIVPKIVADADRKAAEWVLSVGGTVRVNGREKNLRNSAELPKEKFLLTSADAHFNDKVSDVGLDCFRGCKSLTYLNLGHTPVTDAGLEHFQECKNLLFLDVYNTVVTDIGLANFKDCKNLAQLHLAYNRVTDAGLAHFRGCTDLTVLNLQGTRVTQTGLAHFQDCTKLTHLNLACTEVTDTDLTLFKGCTGLTHLNLDRAANVTDAGLIHFKNCKNLDFILLPETRVTGSGLTQLQDCKSPRIDLMGTPIGDDGLKELAKVTKLVTVNLKKTRVTATGIDALKKALPKCVIDWDGGLIDPMKNATDPDRCAAEWVLSIGGKVRVNGQERQVDAVTALPQESFLLTSVNLRENQNANDAGLALFKDCTNLKQIDLYSTNVSDVGLENFKDCKNMTGLNLAGTRVTNAGLAYFKDCKDLLDLNLVNTKVSDAGLAYFKDCKKLSSVYLHNTKLTDAGLAHFKNCKELTQIDLSETPVSDAGIAHFKDCKNLTWLWLGYTKISDSGLAHFKDCKNLAWLELGNTQVTDDGLAHLRDSKNLTQVSLKNTRVSDAGLAVFIDCQNMTSLNLGGTLISDKCLLSLNGFKHLKYLDLRQSMITAKGLEDFRAAIPGCKIDHDGGTIEPGKTSAAPDRKAAE